eukprot:g15710.t1
MGLALFLSLSECGFFVWDTCITVGIVQKFLFVTEDGWPLMDAEQIPATIGMRIRCWMDNRTGRIAYIHNDWPQRIWVEFDDGEENEKDVTWFVSEKGGNPVGPGLTEKEVMVRDHVFVLQKGSDYCCLNSSCLKLFAFAAASFTVVLILTGMPRVARPTLCSVAHLPRGPITGTTGTTRATITRNGSGRPTPKEALLGVQPSTEDAPRERAGPSFAEEDAGAKATKSARDLSEKRKAFGRRSYGRGKGSFRLHLWPTEERFPALGPVGAPPEGVGNAEKLPKASLLGLGLRLVLGLLLWHGSGPGGHRGAEVTCAWKIQWPMY